MRPVNVLDAPTSNIAATRLFGAPPAFAVLTCLTSGTDLIVDAGTKFANQIVLITLLYN